MNQLLENMIIEEVKGIDLSRELIDFMVKQRLSEYGENIKDFENKEQESLFFFLKYDLEIKAFGMLKPIKLYHMSREYHILGLGNVMAVEKSKGYGTKLMNHIRHYLDVHRLPSIGNTHKDNFEFYQKCKFTFIPGLVERFVYVDEVGTEHGGEWDDYGMFVYDRYNAIADILHSGEKIMIKVPLW